MFTFEVQFFLVLLVRTKKENDSFSPGSFSPDSFSPDSFSPDSFSPGLLSAHTDIFNTEPKHKAYKQVHNLIGQLSWFVWKPRPTIEALSVRLFGTHQDSDGSVHTC